MVPALLSVALVGFLTASVFYLLWVLAYRPALRRGGGLATAVGTLALAAATVAELATAAGPTLPTPGRVILVILLGVTVAFSLARLLRDVPLLGPALAPIATVVSFALAWRAAFPLPPPAAHSIGAVTVLHISVTIVGFLLFVPAYVLSVLFLHQEHKLKVKKHPQGRLPSLLSLEQNAWRLLFVGFPLYSLGIFLGALWQGSVEQGGVRPEHVLSLTAWLLYGYAIIQRVRTGWRGKRAAILLIGAFVATLGAVLLYMVR